jgi:hypothetical protein
MLAGEPLAALAEKLAQSVDDALRLLNDLPAESEPADANAPKQVLDNLLDECLVLCDIHEAQTRHPVRTLHHFACTGGTLISKCIAVQPNVQLLSEVDPFSSLHYSAKPAFAPTDMITLVRQSNRGASAELVLKLFFNSIETVLLDATARGLRLVLRDHTHSHYCTGGAVNERPTFRELVKEKYPTLSLVTVRHPLDSYLSLSANKWIHFAPYNIEEYARRYHKFLDDYASVAIVRYEDLIDHPHATMREICRVLDLAYQEQFFDLFNVVQMSGDSGRAGGEISLRQRRPVPTEVEKSARESVALQELLERLGYVQ